MRRHAVAATILALGLGACTAQAATVSVSDDGVLRYEAAAGEANRVLITEAGATYGARYFDVSDAGAILLSTDLLSCTPQGLVVWRCLATRRLVVSLGDGDDHATIDSNAYRAEVQGGTGNDVLSTGDAEADTLQGGPGNDVLDGGGNRYDAAIFSDATGPVQVDLSDPGPDGPADSLDTLTRIEDVLGGPKADHIVGSGVRNRLVGGAGDDWLEGLAGNDSLTGGAGADLLDCGADTDEVLSKDPVDPPSIDCEL